MKLIELWFDVGIKRYTTTNNIRYEKDCCGLMQESKDIQQNGKAAACLLRCGLMQESKDIQPLRERIKSGSVVV